jgi:uncharacterized membrane protein (UPF0127 family)
MAKLMRGDEILASKVEFAHSPWSRAKGLLGRKSLPPDQAMWLKPCNNIHTFFMRFPIDVVFTDKNLVVRKVHRNVGPWKLRAAFWHGESTFEFAAGFLDRHPIQEGDQLHVGP